MRQTRWAGAWLLGAMVAHSHAAGVDILASGRDGPLQHAVVSLHAVDATALPPPESAEMDQRDLQFAPRVLAVTQGTRVRFPNRDNLRHQVYSFSPAKTFELPLYSGTPAAPVQFDRAGVVELGCNIHDGMIGYVVVLDTPYHAVTDAGGRATLDVPPGDYELRAWHEGLDPAAPAAPARPVAVKDAARLALEVVLDAAAPAAPVSTLDPRLRALQERARNTPRGD